MGLATLIVDDHDEIRTLIRLFLEQPGSGVQVVAEAASGADALTALRAGCAPDAAVIDQMMPGMTGLETAGQLRALRPDLPIVFCSAYVDGKLREGASELGRSRVIGKEEIPRLREILLGLVADVAA